MPAYGVAYDYLFKDHPRSFFAWIEVGAEGAQYSGRLSLAALTVAKNICKTAALFQLGYDIPYAFQSFRTVHDKLKRIETISKTSTPVKAVPLWVDGCRAIGNAAFFADFGRRHIFELPQSPLLKLTGAVANLLKDGYDLYIFACEWRKKPLMDNKNQVSDIPEKMFYKRIFFDLSSLSWDSKSIALLVHKTSNLILIVLSLASLYKGVDNLSPISSIFFTTVYLGSDFVVYYETQEPAYKIINNYGASSA